MPRPSEPAVVVAKRADLTKGCCRGSSASRQNNASSSAGVSRTTLWLCTTVAKSHRTMACESARLCSRRLLRKISEGFQ